MTYINGKKVLSVVKVVEKLVLDKISLINATVEDNTLKLANNYVQDTTLYSFDASVNITTLEMETNKITDNTLILI